MKIIKQNDANLLEMAEALKQGKVIVYPTETCYGLGCDATNQKAVDRLFKIKHRQKDKSVLVIVSGVDAIIKYINWTSVLEDLKQKYWPGPLTVVTNIKDKDDLSSGVIAEDNTIAFRITDHHFASQLCRELGRPIVSTSANISSYKSPYDIESVLEMYKDSDDQPDIIIDSGALPHRSPSTIVKVEGDNIVLLRQGEIILDI